MTLDLITTSTAARIAGRSEGTIRDWARRGRLPCLQLPTGLRLFQRDDVVRAAEEQKHDREIELPATA